MKRLLFWFCFLLIAPLQSANAAIAIDNTSSDFFNNSSSLSFSHTTGSGSERFMLVGVSLWNEDLESVSSVTYGGVSLTRIGSVQNSNDSRVEIWKLLNPSSGSANVVVSFSSWVQKGAGAGAMTFTGVDQINPHDTFRSNTGESGQASISVSSASGDIVFVAVASEEQDDPLDIDAGTERWNVKVSGNGEFAGAGGTRNGSNSTTLRWDLDSSDDWAIAGVSINPSAASTPLPAPRLEYRFDDCSLAAGVTDSVGIYDGTANNTDSTDAESRINRSLNLSATGTSDWVTLPQSSVNSLNDFSISTWIKTSVSKSQQEIFHALGSSSGDDEIEVYLVNGNQLRLNVGGSGSTVNAGSTLTDNSWHHLLVTRSANQMCLYVDGAFAACHTSGGAGQISINNASAVVLGQEQDSFGGSFDAGQAFDGYMDEFKIYSSALTASHANQIFTNEGGGLNADGTTRAPVTCSSNLPTPLAEYRFDEASWNGVNGEILDNVGSNNGSIVDTGSGNVSNISDGKICRAGHVGQNTSASAQYAIDTNVDIDDEVGDTGTISFWYRSSAAWGSAGRKVLLSASTANPNNKYFFLTEETNGRLRFGLENTSDADYRYSSSSVFSFGSADWVHLAVTWDMSSRQMQLFVNGNQEINATFGSNQSIGEMLSLYLGDNRSSYIAGEGGVSANGDMDEVLIFNSVLSSANISTIYTNQNGGDNYDGSARGTCNALTPVADWRFDENNWNSPNDVLDTSGNDYHGTAVNSSPSSDAQLCNSADLTLAGTTDYLSMNKDALDGLTDFTMIVWAKSTGTQDSTILSAASGNSGAATNEVVFYFDNNTRFWPTITASPFNTSTRLSTTTSAMRDGNWHQLVWTRDASARQSCFFFDGASQGCTTHPSGDDSDPISVVTNGLIIGQDQDVIGGSFDSSQDWEGKLDEFLIFDEVLTQSQIGDIRTNIINSNNWDGTPRVCGSTVSYYEISHSSSALTCEPASITITAKDASDQSIAPANGTTVNFTSELVSGSSATNTFTPSSYTFDGSEMDATVQLIRTVVGTLDIDVTDGVSTDQDGQATDPDIVYTDVAFKFYADGVADAIDTQIAGKLNTLAPNAQTITLKAVQTNSDTGECAALKPGVGVSVDFGYECNSPSSCTANDLLFVNGDATPAPGVDKDGAPNYGTYSVDFDAAGIGSVVFDYRDAGQIKLHVKADIDVGSDGATATVLGSSNLFVVRPFAFGFPDITASGAAMSLPAGDETGGNGFTSAGSDFELSINAYRYQAEDDDGVPAGTANDGIPDEGVDVTNNGVTPNFTGVVTLDVDSFTPASGTEGDLTGATTPTLDTYAVRAGAAEIATLQYDEVGSINITASHLDYLGQSDADIASVSLKVGRFYPDHFALSGDSVTAACAPLAATHFTYMQQPFSEVKYSIEARAKGVTDASAEAERITQNYDITDYTNTASLALRAEDNNDGDDKSGRLSSSISSGWNNGAIDESANDIIYQRQNSGNGLEDGPFSSVLLGVSITSELDNRGFDSSELTMKADESNNCVVDGNCNAVSLGAAQLLRYGRLRTQSAHGPETEDIAVPFVAEYWDGSAFVTHVDDSCTTQPLSNIRFDGNVISSAIADRTVTVGDGATVGSLSTVGSNAQSLSGDFSLLFSAPGAAASGSDNTGYFPVSVINIDDWLRYDWDQDGAANDASLPDAIVTFGRARGNDRMIFWQERYQ